MLKWLISSDARLKILSLLIFNSDREFYLREIVRMTGKNPNSVRIELNNLERAGIISSKVKGRFRYYSANKNSPVFTELRSLFLKTEGVAAAIRENLEKLGSVDFAFIYGSFARGEEKEKSDIDLIVIGKIDKNALIKIVSDLEKTLSRKINYVTMTVAEFGKRINSRDPFLTNVLKDNRIPILGEIPGRIGNKKA